MNIQLLDRFYTNLLEKVLRAEKKLLKKSVLFTLMKIKSNKSYKYIVESVVKMYPDLKDDFLFLEQKQMIRQSDGSPTEYVLTAKGIWEAEKILNGFQEANLLDFIQSSVNFAPAFSNKGIADKDKVILLAMIGVRNFCKDTVMDVNDENARDHWLEIFKECYNFLLEYSFISKISKLFVQHGHEHPVSYLMERLNELPKYSQQIFCFANNRKYYLDIFKNNHISTEELSLLFRLVFSKIDNLATLYATIRFCNDISNNQAKFVRDDFRFIDSETDFIIKETLQSFYTVA